MCNVVLNIERELFIKREKQSVMILDMELFR